jgi:hypothetical protein
MTPEATLTRLREYLVGPSRFMNLMSCFELGIIDTLRENPGLTAVKLGEVIDVKPDAVEQLLQLLVKEDFVAYDDASDSYTLAGLGGVAEEDMKRVLAMFDLVKVTSLRQLFYLTETVRTGKVVGLKEFYDFDGTLFAAVGEHQDLRENWAPAMDNETVRIDPWFFENIDVPAGSRVLDVAGNTGLGAVHTYQQKKSPGLHVTTFDLPAREQEALENFRKHGVAEHCSFIGGDVFAEIPKGYDIVLLKHFLAMWDKDDVFKIFTAVNRALEVGGEINLLIPLYPENNEDIDSRSSVDFYPTFFIGCAMGQGGGQKVSTYRRWLKECGFEVTSVKVEDASNIPPDAIPVHAIVCAKKTSDIDA